MSLGDWVIVKFLCDHNLLLLWARLLRGFLSGVSTLPMIMVNLYRWVGGEWLLWDKHSIVIYISEYTQSIVKCLLVDFLFLRVQQQYSEHFCLYVVNYIYSTSDVLLTSDSYSETDDLYSVWTDRMYSKLEHNDKTELYIITTSKIEDHVYCLVSINELTVYIWYTYWWYWLRGWSCLF